jgi:hypothetical protein
MIVGIEKIGAVIRVTSEMKLHYAFRRHRVDITMRVEAMVEGVHEDIVDVQQNPAISVLSDCRKEFPFRQPRVLISHVARDILNQNPPPESVLHLADSSRGMRHGLLGMRQRQQIVQVASADSRPT